MRVDAISENEADGGERLMQKSGNLVWIDLEMTGLNPQEDKILEVATVVTDSRLEILANGPVLALYQPEEVLANMDTWNQQHHRKSGLWDRVCQSNMTCREAELETLAFIKQWIGHRDSPMCGSSVWHDRRFLTRYMPELEAYFHYRNIDVSTIKELASRWAPNLPQFSKQCHHLAQDDICESIAELQYYRDHFICTKVF